MPHVQCLFFYTDLKSKLRKAKNTGNFKEIASLHNTIGYHYRMMGAYEEALEHHLVSKRMNFPRPRFLSLRFFCLTLLFCN